MGKAWPAVVCLQIWVYIPLNMTPLGNRPFPSKQWGRGGDQQRHLFHWKPSVGRVKESQDCLCFRHFLLDPERRSWGGKWLNVLLVVPFLSPYTLQHTCTHLQHTNTHTHSDSSQLFLLLHLGKFGTFVLWQYQRNSLIKVTPCELRAVAVAAPHTHFLHTE